MNSFSIRGQVIHPSSFRIHPCSSYPLWWEKFMSLSRDGLIITQTGASMLKKSTFQEIDDLIKKSWKIWLAAGLICPFVGGLMILNGAASTLEILSIIIIPATVGGLLPIGYFWALIKSKNISKVRIVVFFMVGTLSTFVFFSIFALMFVFLIGITIGLPL